jgi:hypothetical protein
MKKTVRSLALSLALLSLVASGCEDLGVPPHILPTVITFRAGPRDIVQGQSVQFKVQAAAELGLVRAIIDFRDGTKSDTMVLSGSRDSSQTTHTYLIPGIFRPSLTIEDASGQRAITSDSVYVRDNKKPQISSLLMGTEGLVSSASKDVLVRDFEGDPLTISISPLSPGLVFRLNANNDSIIYYLTNPNDNGSKQGKITVVDQMNRTQEKVINIQFVPRDDISGRVRDRFEGSYLADFKPVVVMQGPLTGWVAVTTGSETVKVPVDAGGRYTFPKLSSTNHTLRAFITNGRDSSFVATYQLAPGDRTFDIGVETNAGTGMPLHRLLSLYQTVNFRLRDPLSSNSSLVGMDLKSSTSVYKYYLVTKGITSSWLNARSLTAEQQVWIEGQIQTRCLAHLPPANRPGIVRSNPNEPLPLRDPYPRETALPYSGYMIVYVNLLPWRNDLTLWDDFYDGVVDCARIALDGGDMPSPPYGLSVSGLVQMIGNSISGNGSMQDQYYIDKTTRAQNTVLDSPSIADMKLDWQVVFETPKFNNNLEAKYFRMPESPIR